MRLFIASTLAIGIMAANPAPGRAEHAKINLDASGSGDQVTAFVDQTPPEHGKNPRPRAQGQGWPADQDPVVADQRLPTQDAGERRRPLLRGQGASRRPEADARPRDRGQRRPRDRLRDGLQAPEPRPEPATRCGSTSRAPTSFGSSLARPRATTNISPPSTSSSRRQSPDPDSRTSQRRVGWGGSSLGRGSTRPPFRFDEFAQGPGWAGVVEAVLMGSGRPSIRSQRCFWASERTDMARRANWWSAASRALARWALRSRTALPRAARCSSERDRASAMLGSGRHRGGAFPTKVDLPEAVDLVDGQVLLEPGFLILVDRPTPGDGGLAGLAPERSGLLVKVGDRLFGLDDLIGWQAGGLRGSRGGSGAATGRPVLLGIRRARSRSRPGPGPS